ncbi:MAG TPA: flippase [Polaromonas sp.]|uniref:flippase n=1 Tax=Polaromonas sp. UBA4122 TaxID=1947074 RepID=UPI000EC19C3F|nr:flippase [Polaromonas sp. UBA4122]HAL39435.1 flippase [Polaromonas sp.]
MSRNSIARNTLALGGVQVANLILPLVTLPYLLRVLGPEQFGVYGFSQAILAYGVVLTEYGFNLSATQRMARAQGNQTEINRIFWSVQAAKALLALCALSLLTLAVCVVPQLWAVWPVMLASTPVILGAVLFPQWLFQGLERMGFVTLCTIAARALSIPLIFWWVKTDQDTWRVALIQTSVTVAAGLLAWGLIWHGRMVSWQRSSLADIGVAMKDGWHIFISTAAISLYTTTNPVVLGFLSNHTAVGLFTAADKIRQASQSLFTPFSNAVYPRVSALMAQDASAGLALVRKVLLIQGGLTLAISCSLWLLAPWAVHFVMGQQYEGAVSVLRVLAAVPFLIGLSNVFGIQTMLPLGLKKHFSRIVMASGLINLALLFVLVPLWQADGAAAAVLLTEGLVTLTMAMVLRSADIHLLHLPQLQKI